MPTPSFSSIFFTIEASPRQNESTLSFALGSHSIYHNGTFSASQMRKSKLACDLPWREKVREANDRTRYLFNGKELDNETNLYYYGARYFEPKEILWYGCDPLREKYPFTSSYVYCNGNPVKYVDPDGRDWYSYQEENGETAYVWKAGKEKTIEYNGQTCQNIGARFEKDGYYYSLFGQKVKSDTKTSFMFKAIDEAIISMVDDIIYAQEQQAGIGWTSEPQDETTTSFYYEKQQQNTSNKYRIKYAGGEGTCSLYSKKKCAFGHITNFPTEETERGGYFGESRKGYFLVIKNSCSNMGDGMDIVDVRFSPDAAKRFKEIYYKQFPELLKKRQ